MFADGRDPVKDEFLWTVLEAGGQRLEARGAEFSEIRS